MGTVPLVGAVMFVVAGVIWYRLFGQSRAVKESAARDALRLREDQRLVQTTEAAVASPSPGCRPTVPGAGSRSCPRPARSPQSHALDRDGSRNF